MVPLLRHLQRLLQHVVGAAAAVLASSTSTPVQSALLVANVVVLSVAARKLRRARFAAVVRALQDLDADALASLLRRQLPMWVKFGDWERGEHLQQFITLAWPTFNRMICSIIKREVEERLGSHGEFGRVSFARLSFGKQPPVVTGVKGVPIRDEEQLAMVIDIEVRWAGEPDVVMQLSGIPGAAVAVRTCQVVGMLRVVLSPIEEELPFLTGVTVSLIERPYLDFDVRVLGGDVMSLPALGSWLRASVASIIQERMVWPENLGWRWGPSWDRQRAAAASGGRALLAGEQQRRKQLPPPLGVLLVEVVGAELEPRRSTFLGRLKPVSSRVSLLLPAAAPLMTADGGLGGHAISGGAAAARAVLQRGLTSVQDATCRPCWQQSFAFVVSSRHQVLHLLLSHKRGGVLAKGVVQALGADVPLGSTELAVADILGEAAAQEEWTVQEMLLEAAKMEVHRAAAAAAGAESDADTAAGYQSAADEDAMSWVSASPGSVRSGSLGFAFAATAAAQAAAAQAGSDDDDGGWARVGSAGSSAAAVAAVQARQQHWQRAGTPPPQALSKLIERQGSSSRDGGGAGSSVGRDQWRQEEQWRQRHHSAGGSFRQEMRTPPPPARVPSWRRSSTRSPSPDLNRRGTAPSALVDPAALMQLQMAQRKPEIRWLAEEGLWVDVSSANVFTLAGLLEQAATAPEGGSEQPESPRSSGSEEEGGWLGRLRGYILGKGEGEVEEGEEFAPTQAPLAGKLQLRLSWQPVEEEQLPQQLLLSPRAGQAAAAAQQQGRQEGVGAGERDQQQQQPAAAEGNAGDVFSPPASARNSLQLQRQPSSTSTAAGLPDTQQGQQQQQQAPSTVAKAAVVLAAVAAVESVLPQQGVLAVRVAHTKLDYATDLSYPVLAVGIDRRPAAVASAATDAAAALLGVSPTKVPASAAAAAAAAAGSAAGSPTGLLPKNPAASTASLASLAASAVAAEAAAAAAGAAPQQRWISMESTPGSRMGLLHWGQVFYIPTSLSEADCQEGRVVVELGEVASAARFNLFGPALYSLDAQDSFGDDVKLVAAAGIPLKSLLHQRRLGGSWRLKEATPTVADADRLDLGRATVQLAWFPLAQQQAAIQAEADVLAGAAAAASGAV